ncbi:hypothetical protein LEMLEM_LOCUS27710 [Lemmus lemmus]
MTRNTRVTTNTGAEGHHCCDVKILSRPEAQKKLGMAECPLGTIQPTSPSQ